FGAAPLCAAAGALVAPVAAGGAAVGFGAADAWVGAGAAGAAAPPHAASTRDSPATSPTIHVLHLIAKNLRMRINQETAAPSTIGTRVTSCACSFGRTSLAKRRIWCMNISCGIAPRFKLTVTWLAPAWSAALM